MTTPDQIAYPELQEGSDTPHLRILMGHGRVEVGDAVHEGLPALWFGNDGQGMGFERDRNEHAKRNETLLIITFANLGGLEAIEFAVARVRAKLGAAPAAKPVAPLTLDEVRNLSSMQAGVPWTDDLLQALAECIKLHEQCAAADIRPFDPADLTPQQHDAFWEHGELPWHGAAARSA